ncbi:hypothetical protein [Rathayibacter agropyri]
MVITASVSRSSERETAAFIASMFRTTSIALPDVATPISARATCLAEAVRFSISELEALSERRRIAAKGAASDPASASKRVSSRPASSLRATRSAGRETSLSVISGGTEARYGPRAA